MGTATSRTRHWEVMPPGLLQDPCFLGVLKLYVKSAFKTCKTINLLSSRTFIQPLVLSSTLSHHLQIHIHYNFFPQNTHSLHNKSGVSSIQPTRPASITVIPSYLCPVVVTSTDCDHSPSTLVLMSILKKDCHFICATDLS
jgi:hypothetical protein